jgi:hypothetical protein
MIFDSVLSLRIVNEVPIYERPRATIAAFKVAACRGSRPKVGIAAALLASARAVVRVVNNMILVTNTEAELYTNNNLLRGTDLYTISTPPYQVSIRSRKSGIRLKRVIQAQDNTRLVLGSCS